MIQHTTLSSPVSKLPNVGVTVFSRMSALAQQHQAINLGQGFPDFDPDPRLLHAVTTAMQQGHNQYPPMIGVAPLRQAIAQKIWDLYGTRYDADSEITVTAGATQGLLTAILALVHTGDEVIVLEPAYDSYIPSILLAGGIPVTVAFDEADFRPDFDRIQAAITPKTRMIIVNTPHNPTGCCWLDQDWQALANLLEGTPIVLLSDEVYEHMAFTPLKHRGAACYPQLKTRSVVVSSFGKTYHVTGWKVGYVCAPEGWMGEFRKVHQFNVFTVNTPMQYAIAAYMADSTHHLNLPAFYQIKRDFVRQGLAHSGFELLPCQGTYFQCVRYGAMDVAQGMSDAAFCEYLIREVGVAAIPLSAFYADGRDQGIIRFCFAKQTSTLAAALARLGALQ